MKNIDRHYRSVDGVAIAAVVWSVVVSAPEIAEAAIRDIEALNLALNAVIDLRYDIGYAIAAAVSSAMACAWYHPLITWRESSHAL